MRDLRTRVRPRQPRWLSMKAAGPFRGVRDSLDPSTWDPRLASVLQNCYPLDAARGAAVVGRPGFQQLGSQMGDGSMRDGQQVYQYTKLDGTEYSLIFCGGKMYSVDWSARTTTEVTLSGAGVGLPAEGLIFAATVADYLVIQPNDGVYKPWLWDGSTFTSVANASLAYGPIGVYYGKVVFTKWAERNTLIWSEEADPTIGYEAGGYNNAWTLGQTDQEAIYAVVGDNEALKVLRARSSTAISGAVTPEFASTGTREALSETDGTLSPGALVTFNRTLYFLNAEGQLQAATPGLGVLPLWGDYAETVRGLDVEYLGNAVACYDPTTQLLLFGVVEVGYEHPNMLLAFDARQSPVQYVGAWRGFPVTAMGVLKDANGRPVLVHVSEDGYAYDHGRPSGTVWTDGFAAGAVAIEHIVEAGWHAFDESLEKHFHRIDFSLSMFGPLTNLRVNYTTPHGLSDPQTTSLTGSHSLWDVATWDVSDWTSDALERTLPIGINVDGRWLRWRMVHSGSGEQFGLILARPTAYALSTMPGIP